MIHNGTEVKDAEGRVIGHIYGETADETPVSVADETPKTPAKKPTKKTASTKK